MFRILAAAIFTVIAVSIAGLSSTHGCDGDGYGVCRYPIKYATRKLVRNAIETDTHNRAAGILVEMTSAKIQDRFAGQ